MGTGMTQQHLRDILGDMDLISNTILHSWGCLSNPYPWKPFGGSPKCCGVLVLQQIAVEMPFLHGCATFPNPTAITNRRYLGYLKNYIESELSIVMWCQYTEDTVCTLWRVPTSLIIISPLLTPLTVCYCLSLGHSTKELSSQANSRGRRLSV